MGAWSDILTPALAVFAVVVAVGLAVQLVRQGRRMRRLEDQLAALGAAASESPLQRLTELQQRMSTSQGGIGSRLGGLVRPLVIGLAVVIVLAVAGGAVWALFLRDSGGGGGTQAATRTTGTTTGGTQTTVASDPGQCRTIKPLSDNGLVQVTIFNASGVTGAALDKVGPLISNGGYTLGVVANPPDNRSDLKRSQVQYVKAADRNAACNVAKTLGLQRVSPVEGYTTDSIGGADVNVVVVVGKDLANR